MQQTSIVFKSDYNEQIREIEEKIKEYNYNYLKAVSNFVTADINNIYACLEEVRRYEGFMVEAAYLRKQLCKLIEISKPGTALRPVEIQLSPEQAAGLRTNLDALPPNKI